MRIGINATFRMHGGGMVHLRSLLRAWQQSGVPKENQIYVFTRPEGVSALDLQGSNDMRACPVPLRRGKLLWEQACFPRLLSDYNLDVLFCPGGIIPFRVRVPAVMMIQNAAPFSAAVTLRSVGLHHFAYFRAFGAMARASASVAARVIFISKFFREEFQNRYGFPSNRADVIYHGRDTLGVSPPDTAAVKKLGLKRPYILTVSHLYPYKNIPALIEGYALARDVLKARGLRLFIVGNTVSKSHTRLLHRMVSRLGLQDWVVLPGGVPHSDIAGLLAHCEFLAFQSTCENCPNTLIEALAAGVPIACSNAGVMPEIAGDGAIYFDPFSPASIAQSLTRLATDMTLRDSLRHRAIRQSKFFPTWAEVGDLTLRSLEKAVEIGEFAGVQK